MGDRIARLEGNQSVMTLDLLPSERDRVADTLEAMAASLPAKGAAPPTDQRGVLVLWQSHERVGFELRSTAETIRRPPRPPEPETACAACGEPADGRQGLPVDTGGRIVHNGYTGEWVAVPACRGCNIVHAAGGPVALEAHIEATKDLRASCAQWRAIVGKVQLLVDGLET
jgi:hypothetical protein